MDCGPTRFVPPSPGHQREALGKWFLRNVRLEACRAGRTFPLQGQGPCQPLDTVASVLLVMRGPRPQPLTYRRARSRPYECRLAPMCRWGLPCRPVVCSDSRLVHTAADSRRVADTSAPVAPQPASCCRPTKMLVVSAGAPQPPAGRPAREEGSQSEKQMTVEAVPIVPAAGSR